MKPLSKRSYIKHSGIREIMEKASQSTDVIHLEVGEPNVDTPENIRVEAINAINSGHTHYTPSAGIMSLRNSIVKHHQQKDIKNIDYKNVVVTPGAVNALALALSAIVDSGEEVLIPDPGWPNYEQMIIAQEAVPVRYTLKFEDSFEPDIEDLEKLITNKTKALIINTPGNPTGAVFKEETIKGLLRLVEENDIYLISDEVYDSIIFDGKHVSPFEFSEEDKVISVYSFSKSYAMTGWRIGYALAPIPVANLMTKLIEPMVSCTTSISQKAAEEAINGPQDFVATMTNIYKDRRNKVAALLRENNIKFSNPQGAFYMLIDFSGTKLEGKKIAHILLDKVKVATAPGETFGETTKNLIRISLATNEQELLLGVNRIIKYITQLNNGDN